MPQPPVNVLLIEDDDDHAAIVSRQLTQTGRTRIHRAKTMSEGLEAARSKRFDVALLDPGLPDCDRDQTLPRLLEAAHDLPVVILTTLDDPDSAVEAVKEGAEDSLVKSNTTPSSLMRSIRYAVERKAARLQLEKYAEELERSNSDFQHFAHFAAHELKSPLWSISLASGILLEKHRDQFDDESRQLLEGLGNTVKQMDAIVQGLLEFSRVESRGVPPQPVDSQSVLDDLLKVMADEINSVNAQVTHDPLPTVRADPRQLPQVLANLLSNAIKYRREGVPPQIHVSAEKRPPNWLFTVKDNGLGVPARDRDRIFGLFIRAHDKNKYPGTGIGLSLVKRIVERHAGQVWVESNEGQGSAFHFTLPLEPVSNKES